MGSTYSYSYSHYREVSSEQSQNHRIIIWSIVKKSIWAFLGSITLFFRNNFGNNMLFNPQKRVRWDHIIITVVVRVIDRGHGGPEIAFFFLRSIIYLGARHNDLHKKIGGTAFFRSTFTFQNLSFLQITEHPKMKAWHVPYKALSTENCTSLKICFY